MINNVNKRARLKLPAILLCFAILIVHNAAWATGDHGIEQSYFSVLAGSTLVQNSSPLAVNATAELTYVSANESTKTIRNIVTLSLFEETPDYIPGNFTASVTVRIAYGADAASATTIDQVLTVTYDPSAGVKYDAKQYFSFAGAQYVKVTVLSINAPTLGNYDTKRALIVQNEMRVTRYFTLNSSASPITFTTATPAPGDDELSVTWMWPNNTGNTHTQLEWTWLEDELAPTIINTDLLFQNNGTRVELPAGVTSYKVPLLYGGTGKLYCRIRAVNINKTGSRTDGPWALPTPLTQSFNGHNNALNWQATITFSEDGKRKAIVRYYDGSLRSRQTVTKDNTTNTVVTAETFYDGQGRPAVQVLPVPGINNNISYIGGLNLFKSNTQLNLPNDQTLTDDPAKFFDMQPIATAISITPALATNTGASKYYSTSNPELSSGTNAHIPDAEGYPYTVTRYMPDATGRVMAQSGVGAAMQMGKGHETKYYYGTPAQEELDGLFGTEAGNYTHYYKNMVKDANGQMTVSYTDMHGRTIASALAGDAPTNLVALDLTQYPNQTGTNINRNLLDNNSNVVKNNSIESVNTLLVPATTNYSFRYELNADKLSLTSCTGASICYDCLYDLEITITDESGDHDPIVRKFKNVSLRSGDDCNSTSSSPTFSKDTYINVSNSTCDNVSNNVIQFCESLQPGSYSVRKTLTISEASLQADKDLYITKGLCDTEQTLITTIYNALVSSSGCGNTPPANTCSDCLAKLGTQTDYRTNFLNSIGNPSPVPADVEKQIAASYNEAKLRCDKLCNTTSQALAIKKQLMLADMIPYSGQYAQQTGSGSMFDKYNIFSTANASSFAQPFYKTPLSSTQGPDLYYTNYGTVDFSIQPDGTRTNLGSVSADDFTNQFNYSWADALLPYHPEYNKLVYAQNNLTDSYNWITTFNNTTTYAAAVANGYIFVDDPSLTDPFYTKATTSKAGMVTMINNNYQQNLSLWQIAYGDAACKTITDPTQKNTCYTQAPKTPSASTSPSFSSLTTAQKDQAWITFRNLYSTERDNQVNKYITDNSPLSDAQTLVNQGYLLRFPTSNSQMAQQFGTNQQSNVGDNNWTWYPTTAGGSPNINSIPDATAPAQTYASRCNSYVTQWVKSLTQCTALTGNPDSATIVNQITAGMALVCQKGSDDKNPFGASTVAPATPADGTPRSFEEVITNVFNTYHISWDNLCNPFVIEFPKPYSQGPVFTKQVISAIDTCNCSRFAQLKSEALAAQKDPSNLVSFNLYLRGQYGDTLTKALFDALTTGCSIIKTTVCSDVMVATTLSSSVTAPCGCVFVSASGSNYNYNCPQRICNTINPYPLASAQPMPEFLKCGFVAGSSCLTCAQISSLTAEFKSLPKFSEAYKAGPVFTGSDLTPTNIRDNVLFAQFLNFRTGMQYTWMDYAQAAAAGSCNLANYGSNSSATQQIICADAKPLTDTGGIFVKDDPCQKVYNMAVAMADQILQQRTDSLLANFEKLYRAKCLSAQSIESFTVNYTNKEYHYTLYYYDMAGNLVTTVPPKGVHPDFSAAFLQSVKDGRTNDTRVAPAHNLLTSYRYNSLNALVAQNSPDANTSYFWYDMLGRLVISQNARQADAAESPEGGSTRRYRYTLYDAQGRITEVGQKPQTSGMNQTISQDPVALDSWINSTGGTKEQITFTVYDIPFDPLYGTYIAQQNLRNRVSYQGTKKMAGDDYYTATFFTYDVHGNVDTLLQDYKGVQDMGNSTSDRFKLITYNYDLISGKVNGVSYQPGRPDAFYHRFSYDAENRLTMTETSRDNIYWERDAAYSYYKHGSLARAELGQLRVQGIDYAYTLQGWLKGVNTTAIGDGSYDIGKDGYTGSNNSNVARDVLGYGLHYYDAVENNNTWIDYKPIGGTSAFARPGTGSNFVSLYNGNIGGIGINNAGLAKGLASTTNALPLFYNYRYDQLNRLVSMQAYKGLDVSTNQWTASLIPDYAEAISYDPNGNILTYNRKGAPTVGSPLNMDALTYNYDANKNRLNYVHDDVTSTYTEDIESQNSGNYTYDATGNLKTDLAEGITNVTWTAYGKISGITKNGNSITYTYDATGNRITKTAGGITTVYVRDGSGNVQSVYAQPTGSTPQQKEIHLYSSSRLGLVSQVTTAPTTTGLMNGYGTATISTFTRNEKNFELCNHVGNVLVTVGDKKIQSSSNGISIDYYTADVMTANDYYPFGMTMPGRTYTANGSYRYGFNSQEKSTELNQDGNLFTAKFWEYDSRTGHRWNVDPSPTLGSPYATLNDNPIWFSDLLGDSSVIDNKGYIVHYDPKDKDLRVFMQQDGKLKLIGKLGGPLDANGWFGNLLKENAQESKGIHWFNPWGFKNRVKQYAKWDYKYRSPANEDPDGVVNNMPYHILGIAFYRKDKEKGTGDLPETEFTFDGNTGRAEDLNNFHFGVVGKAYNVFSEEYMLKKAGEAEMGKWADDYKIHKRPTPQVPADWRPIIYPHRPPAETEPELGPPYGDNPVDHDWIKRGFKYYDDHKN